MSKLRNYLIVLFVLILESTYSQITISGKITDAGTGETLVGATVYNPANQKGTSTNAYGFYSLNIPSGKQELTYSFVGYSSKTIIIDLSSDSVVNIQLPTHNEIKEITVTESKRERFLTSTRMGENRLTSREIEQLPALLGETDVVKAIQSLPGVNAGSDGSAGISVRGGSPDQTQILLDEVPVYNVNHLFGYFSVFNNDAIKEATLVKCPIPAQYGGRLSSVLDVRMKEGNLFEHTGKASLSTLSGKYTIEGPIVKGKGSYMLSGRVTWPGLPLKLFYYLTNSNMEVFYSFFDLNGKINYEVSSNDRLFVSFYAGNDKFKYTTEGNEYSFGNESAKYLFKWGNNTTSARWNHIFSPKLFSNLTVYFSRYKYNQLYDLKNSKDTIFIDTHSSLADASFCYDFDLFLKNTNKIKFGTKISYLFFLPETTETDSSTTRLSSYSKAPVFDFYISDEYSITDRFSLNIGLRQSILKRNDKFESHFAPRISARYSLSHTLSLKAGYTSMVQHLHQLTNPSLSLPTTMWVLSNASLESSTANLSSLGLYYMSHSGAEISGEIYYNTMDNVIDYQPGKENYPIDENFWNQNIMVGNGVSYGIELFAKHKIKSYSGQLSYTYSRSFRKYNNLENIGFYPYMYDRPHNISFQLTKEFENNKNSKFTKRISILFSYMSGHLISFSNYTIPAIIPGELHNYSKSVNNYNFFIPHPNNVRLPAVHHLDISFHLDNSAKEKSSWIFSIYNVYNKKNISFYYIENNKIKGAALLPIIPSVTWNYKF